GQTPFVSPERRLHVPVIAYDALPQKSPIPFLSRELTRARLNLPIGNPSTVDKLKNRLFSTTQ
ncbi:MAG: hypothetical protein V4693_23220, partial [Pseudomonadota bacterium]